MAEVSELATIDCKGLAIDTIVARMRATAVGANATLENAELAANGFAAGLSIDASFVAKSPVGDYAFAMADIANFDLIGEAGDSLGHSLQSGRILVRGQVGDYLGAYARGGFIVVHQNSGNRVGFGLSGADVFVRGVVGDEAGCNMEAGVLVLANGAGENTGRGMAGGSLYIRGEVKSFAPHVKSIRMKDADSMRLSLLLARAGIKGGVKEFKAYRSRK